MRIQAVLYMRWKRPSKEEAYSLIYQEIYVIGGKTSLHHSLKTFIIVDSKYLGVDEVNLHACRT